MTTDTGSQLVLRREFAPITIGEAQAALDRIAADLTDLNDIVIDSAFMATEAQALIAKIATAHDELDAERLGKTKELRDGQAWVNSGYNPAIETLDSAMKGGKLKLTAWDKAEKKRAAEEQEAIRKKAAEEAAEIEKRAEEQRQQARDAQAKADELYEKGDVSAANALVQQSQQLLDAAGDTASVAHHVATNVNIGGAGSANSGVKGATKVWKARCTDIAKLIKAASDDPSLIGLFEVSDAALNALAKTNKGNAPIPGVEFYEEDQIRSRRK